MHTLGLLLLTGLASATRSPRAGHVVHEKREVPPALWARTRRLEPDTVLPMRFGMAQSNINRLEEMLMDVAHPDSPNYAQHWSAKKVAETFAPSSETIDVVRAWLADAGLEPGRMRLSQSKGWIDLNATAAEVEALLDAEYHVYTHSTGKEHVACDSYSIPGHVQPHIELITPTLHFDAKVVSNIPRKRKRTNAPIPGSGRTVGQPGIGNGPKSAGKISTIFHELENCDQQITPDCLRALYEIVYTPVATHKNSYGIVEYTPQALLQSDLDLFFANFSQHQVQTSPTFISIDGGVLQTQEESFNFNGESSLDFQYGMTLVNPQPVTLYQAGDLPQGASFNNLLDALDGSFCTFEGGDDPTQDGIYPDPLPGGFDQPESCGIVKPANVISTSYASDEADMTPFYSIRQCNEYGKLGLLGVTILYSSGDEGVAGNGNRCLNPNGTQSTGGKRFNPLFPAVCPFVTAVGATQVNPNSSVFAPEGACEQVIFSGGGFSNVFARPSFQEEAVTSFLKNFPPPYTSAQFNTSASRGFPDLSANGANYVIAVDGEFELVFGTSASSPVVGSIITLINDARIALGKKPVGFINPAIYSDKFRGAFNDITTGGNKGCGTPGFSSAPGWDPVTGLGTPNFPKLLLAWLELP